MGMESTRMHPSVETTTWFRQRNLGAGRHLAPGNELPREVEIYLLVTFALRPHVLPVEVRAFLAVQYFGHGTEFRTIH
jgi:hypothetical protein